MKKTLQELHDEIARLRGTDLRNLTDEQMRQQVHSLIHDTYGVAGTTLNNGRDWIRARPRAPVEGWRNIYDCIYPWPPVGNHGRCHSPGESRYYAAGDIDTALCEVIASPGEYVQLVLSKFSSSEHAPVMTVGQYEFFHHSQQTQFQDPNVLRTMMYFRGWAHEVKIAHLVVDAFLAEQFAYRKEGGEPKN